MDLKGESISLPKNSTLLFDKGSIKNGKLIGNLSKIEAKKQCIFQNMKFSGRWGNTNVYSEWFPFKSEGYFDNYSNFTALMALCVGDNTTCVYMQKGEYWTSTKEFSGAIRIPSNTLFYCQATITELPNAFKYSSLVSVANVTNVSINGGVYIGDQKNHLAKDGEWSHGIEIRGASNIKIKNVECNYFWGDGIDIIDGYNSANEPVVNCKNITIDNCRCLYNRRQGLSIEAVENCRVLNSEFSYTGKYRATPPSAGIDIEAWNTKNPKLVNIRIENCTMKGNKGPSFQSYANAVWGDNYGCYSNDIVLIGCDMYDIAISHTNDIEFRNCKIQKKREQKHSNGVKYVKCKGDNICN